MMGELICPLVCFFPLDDLNTFRTGLHCRYFLIEAVDNVVHSWEPKPLGEKMSPIFSSLYDENLLFTLQKLVVELLRGGSFKPWTKSAGFPQKWKS